MRCVCTRIPDIHLYLCIHHYSRDSKPPPPARLLRHAEAEEAATDLALVAQLKEEVEVATQESARERNQTGGAAPNS